MTNSLEELLEFAEWMKAGGLISKKERRIEFAAKFIEMANRCAAFESIAKEAKRSLAAASLDIRSWQQLARRQREVDSNPDYNPVGPTKYGIEKSDIVVDQIEKSWEELRIFLLGDSDKNLYAKLSIAIQALEWYAEEKNYSEEGAPGKSVQSNATLDPIEYDFELDFGEQAKQALDDIHLLS